MRSMAHPWEHAARNPHQPALIMADSGETLSYGEMMRNADQAAHLFRALGCKTGDTVALLSENNATSVELCWAAKNSGLYYTCISNQLNVDDAKYIVDNCDAKILIASESMTDTATAIAAQLPGQFRLLHLGPSSNPVANAYPALRAQHSATRPQNAVRGASVLYSSGTTGLPKGVRTPLLEVPPTTPPVRHARLLENYRLSPDTVFINPGPFYHAAPLRLMMSVHREGGTVIGFSKFDPAAVLRAIEKYSATHGFFVPTMFNRMLQLPLETRAAVDVSSMRYAIHGAAPCTVELKDAMLSWWGPVLYELYGGTEGNGQTFITPQEWLQKKGSVGKPAAGCEIRIVDDTGETLAANQLGRIYMGNGRRFEYYKDPAKTIDAHDAQGLSTLGDIGYLDEDGYLFLVDRQAHMIISGGVNIYPQEAENVLSTHPAVADVAVIGVPHADFGEEVKAVVKLKQPAADPAALKADIIAFCRARLSAYKCPRSVDFVGELPRSDAGKLLKRLIKAPYWQGRASQIV
jgi:long-chain acyl-CoA synthetase